MPSVLSRLYILWNNGHELVCLQKKALRFATRGQCEASRRTGFAEVLMARPTRRVLSTFLQATIGLAGHHGPFGVKAKTHRYIACLTTYHIMFLLNWIVPMSVDLLEDGYWATKIKRAHNGRQPVARLPFEVATSIFRLLAYADPPGWKFTGKRYTCSGYREDPVIGLGWIPAATHVFSQWRSYALADPFLWALCASEIPTPRVFEALSVRAGSTPLYLNNMRRTLHPDHPVTLVPQHFSTNYDRAQSVTLALGLEEVRKWANLIASTSLPPQLHTLSLNYLVSRLPWGDAPLWEWDYGPYNYSHVPSNLRHVVFKACFLPFPSHNLVTLRLFDKRSIEWAPRTPMLLEILANASKLEYLCLIYWACDATEVPSDSTLTMPSLLELSITCYPDITNWQFNTALLVHLVCPRLKILQCDGALSRHLRPSTPNQGLERVLSAIHV